MDYGAIVGRGWQITWNNKFLWVLGFLAALAKISSNFSNSNSSLDSGPAEVEQILAATAVALTLMCVFMVIGLILWLVSIVARGGLVTAVARIDAGESVTLGEAFSAGTAKIWSLVGMNLLLLLPVFILSIIGVAGMFFILAGSGITTAALIEDPTALEEVFAAGIGLFVVCICGLVCGLALLGIFIQFINAFAYRGIMLQEQGAVESISRGWQLLKANAADVIVLALIFLGISLMYGIAVGIVLVPLTLIAIIPSIALMTEGGAMAAGSLVFLFGSMLCLGIVGAGLNSILTTWQSASFTLAYQEWINKPKPTI